MIITSTINDFFIEGFICMYNHEIITYKLDAYENLIGDYYYRIRNIKQ